MPATIAQQRVSRPVAVATGVCLVVPSALNVVFHLLSPVTSTELPQALAQAAAAPSRAMVAASLQLALPFLGVGVLVLGWRASGAAPRLAAWGAALLATSYLLGTVGSVDNLLQAIVPAHTSPDVALETVRSFADGVGRLSVISIVCQVAGLLILGLALWRSRSVPRGLAGAFLATVPLLIFTHLGDDNRLNAVSWAWLTLVLVGCAVVIIRDSWVSRSNPPGPEAFSSTGSGTTMST